MDIEPLKSILQDSKDKKDTLLYFLPLEVTKQVIHHDYEEKDFYIQERIFCIKRNTLELEFIGRILLYQFNSEILIYEREGLLFCIDLSLLTNKSS